MDHIIPLNMGGEMYDMGNARASCQHCNLTRAKSAPTEEAGHKVISNW